MGGFLNSYIYPGILNSSLRWSNAFINNKYNTNHICIPVKEGDIVDILANANRTSYYAFLKTHNYLDLYSDIDETVDHTRYSITRNTSVTITIPKDCKYLYVLNSNANTEDDSQDWSVQELKLNGRDMLIDVFDYIDNKIDDGNFNDVIESYFESENERRLNSIENLYVRIGQDTINSSNKWGANPTGGIILVPISEGDIVSITAGSLSCFYAILAEFNHETGNDPIFADGETSRRSISSRSTITFTAPANSKYLYILKTTNGINDYYLSSILINGVEFAINTRVQIANLKNSLSSNNTSQIKPLVKYESGSFDSGKATEALYVYIPCGDHYVGYIMYHYIIESVNCNCWRIYSLYKFDNDFNIVCKLTQNGELECALRLQGRDDFSGGSTHGDEIMNTYEIFIDGTRVTDNLSSISSVTKFDELRFVRVSDFYDPADHTTIIAKHTCEYVFTFEKLKIDQTVLWKESEELANCFMAMFTPSKTYTDHFYTDKDLTPKATADYINTSNTNVKKTVIYGQDNGVLFEFDIERYPTGLTGGDHWSLSDNGGINYNKIYYRVANGGTANAGDLWQSTSIYKMKA